MGAVSTASSPSSHMPISTQTVLRAKGCPSGHRDKRSTLRQHAAAAARRRRQLDIAGPRKPCAWAWVCCEVSSFDSPHPPGRRRRDRMRCGCCTRSAYGPTCKHEENGFRRKPAGSTSPRPGKNVPVHMLPFCPAHSTALLRRLLRKAGTLGVQPSGAFAWTRSTEKPT